jgi:hypothetical protein
MRRETIAIGILATLAACNEPVFTNARGALEVGRPDNIPPDPNVPGSGTMTDIPTASSYLPIFNLRDGTLKKPFVDRQRTNNMIAMQKATGAKLAPETAPYLLRDDIAIEVDWTLKNLDTKPGTAKVTLNGSNEFVTYDPSLVMVGPDEDPPPSLLGGTPFDVPAGGTVNGVFREDQLDEAMVDLDIIRRTPIMVAMGEPPSTNPNGNAYRAILERPSPLPDDGLVAGMYEVRLTLSADRHMVLDFLVRVREKKSGVVAEECSTQGGNGMCTLAETFHPTPMTYQPPAMMAP